MKTPNHTGEIVGTDEVPDGRKVVKILLDSHDVPIAGEVIRIREFQDEEDLK